jgi:hypothetical protein
MEHVILILSKRLDNDLLTGRDHGRGFLRTTLSEFSQAEP